VAEKFCKNSIIQGQVAKLKGWGITLDGIGSEFAPLLLYYGG
jgi:hypothetical protein